MQFKLKFVAIQKVCFNIPLKLLSNVSWVSFTTFFSGVPVTAGYGGYHGTVSQSLPIAVKAYHGGQGCRE